LTGGCRSTGLGACLFEQAGPSPSVPSVAASPPRPCRPSNPGTEKVGEPCEDCGLHGLLAGQPSGGCLHKLATSGR
jgi:hypothetical protein